jgi:DNA-binding NtrC family response regulator
LRADIAERLRDAGFEVLEADSGESAVELARNGHGIHVLFTDIRLGGELNGWDVGEMFRSARPEIGVIYASGASVEPPREVAESLFFAKPYDPSAVIATCRELGDRAKAKSDNT